MRLAHLSDLHLGFRRFTRADGRGVNQREADVADAFRRAIDGVIAAAPDLVLIAGDVFHTVRPPNGAILFLVSQLQRLRVAVPRARIVIIGGDHDTPRTVETGVILPLYRFLGADVAVIQPERFRYGDCLVTAVPKASAHAVPPPDPTAAVNVLVVHGEVAGYGNPHPVGAIQPEQLAGYDYVALGHYHSVAQVAPNAWYAGSLEFVSTDPWGESHKGPKGWLLVQLPRPPVLQPIATRRVLDLEPVDAAGLAAGELDRLLAERVAGADVDGAVVRLVVTNVSRELRRALDYAQVRAWKGRALNFNLELRRDEATTSPAARAARFQKLDDLVAQFFGDRALPPDVDRQAFVAQGLEYFRGAEVGPTQLESADVDERRESA